MRCTAWPLACAASYLLLSCGGGGGGGGSSPPAAKLASAPGAAALNAYYQTSHSDTLTGSLFGVSLTLTESFTPNSGMTTFNGASAFSATQIQSISGGGVSNTSSQTVYYTLSPFDLVGAIASTGSPYSVSTNLTAMPAMLIVGQSGPVKTSTAYRLNSLGAVEATQVNTYTVLADTPTTLQFCTTGVTTAVAGNADGITAGTETDCYRVDANGSMSLYSIELTTPSGSVLFQ